MFCACVDKLLVFIMWPFMCTVLQLWPEMRVEGCVVFTIMSSVRVAVVPVTARWAVGVEPVLQVGLLDPLIKSLHVEQMLLGGGMRTTFLFINVNVSISGLNYVCGTAMNWQPVQGVPCLSAAPTQPHPYSTLLLKGMVHNRPQQTIMKR